VAVTFAKPESGSPSGLLCSTCKKMKPRDQFYTNVRNPSGLSYKCRQCTTDYSMAYAKRHGAKTGSNGGVMSLVTRLGLTDDQQALFMAYHERTGMSMTSTIRMALYEFLSRCNGKQEEELTAHQQQEQRQTQEAA
jgi:site-specific recombinase